MTNEDLLKDCIIKKYGSINAFCVQNDIPPTSVLNIFKRGMGGTSINLLLKICKALDISLDSLAQGKIERRMMDIHEVTRFDLELLTAYYDKPEMQEPINILLGIHPKAPNLAEIKDNEK